MEIIILGSGTGVPSLKRGAPGLVIRVGKEILLFDSGSGTLNRLLKAGIDYRKLDYIFYTHFHPDHIAELVPFLFACKYHSSPRTKPLTIFGPKGMRNLYFSLFEVYGEWITPVKYHVEIVELTDNPYKGDGWTIFTKSLRHTDPAIGYRINSIVYSGDTDYCQEIVELARNCDLLILECSFPERYRVKGHLTPRLAGRIARESGCKRLILTHIYPVCDRYNIASECRKEYEGQLTIARDLMHIVL